MNQLSPSWAGLAALLILGLGGFAHAAAPDAAFLRGNEAYAAGKFADARQAYTESLKTRNDENTWYNLGNACFRLDQPGPAIAAYERALLLAPHHAEATANLRFLRQKTGARLQEPTLLQRALGGVPPAVAPWLAIGGAWLGLAWIGSALWRRTGLAGVIGGSLVVLLASAYAAGWYWWRGEQARLAIVLTGAEAKSEPAKDAHNGETLPPGSRVRWISSLPGWEFCEMPSGERAWLPASTVERLITPQS